MKFSILSILILSVSIWADDVPIDHSGAPTLPGLLTQTQCSTFFVSGLFEVLCPSIGSDTCNVHCQCFHGAIWGECSVRPRGAPTPVGTSLGGILGLEDTCLCYYKGDKPEPAGNQKYGVDNPKCANFKVLANNFCTNPVPAYPADICQADCQCTHLQTRGDCVEQEGLGKQCVCSGARLY